MAQLPGTLLLYGCFVVAASVATCLWSLVQAGLDRTGPARRRPPGTPDPAAPHPVRAVTAAAVAAVTASVPAALGRVQLLAALLRAL